MVFRYRTRSIFTAGVILASITVTHAIAQPIVPRHQEPNYQSICEAHTPELEEAFDLPQGVLTAISRVESGRPDSQGIRLGWPWTINHDGKGLFFENKQDMLAYARAHIENGDKRMDLGCMQISVFWHQEQFADLEEMADPPTNIAYAAAFLADLKAKHGSLDQAIRHYHNADPVANTPYVARVYDVWKRISSDAEVTLASIPAGQNILPNTASTRAIATPANAKSFAEDIDKDTTPGAEPPSGMDVASPGSSPPGSSPVIVSADADPLIAVKQRQPHLRGRWDRVERFRKMLNP